MLDLDSSVEASDAASKEPERSKPDILDDVMIGLGNVEVSEIRPKKPSELPATESVESVSTVNSNDVLVTTQEPTPTVESPTPTKAAVFLTQPEEEEAESRPKPEMAAAVSHRGQT